MTIPHEVPAVGMAHGYAMVTGRPQVVMVHVIVGAGKRGRRHHQRGALERADPLQRGPEPAHRGRSARQPQPPYPLGAGILRSGRDDREFVKWDYELRNFTQLETVVDRALAISQAEPQGPVYLTLPREVLAEKHEVFEYTATSRAPRPGAVSAAPETIAETARLLTAARNPIILTKAAGRDPLASRRS